MSRLAEGGSGEANHKPVDQLKEGNQAGQINQIYLKDYYY